MSKQSRIVVALACLVGLCPAAGSQERPAVLDAAGAPVPSSITSFDCGKAANDVERTICRDSGLAAQDGALGEAYGFVRPLLTAAQTAALMRSQRDWIARRDACLDRVCIETAYEERLDALQRLRDARARYLRRNLARVGQCEASRIVSIGPRLSRVAGEPPSGTSVSFADGVSQFDYDRNAAVLASRTGDPVRICLASIPHDCPPGDDRGRFYRVVDIRTGAQWRLPDSSHSCGGA